MANFKISELDVKLGVTVELNGKWVRIDKGLSSKNLNVEDVLSGKELKEQFSKCETILEGEIAKSLKKFE